PAQTDQSKNNSKVDEREKNITFPQNTQDRIVFNGRRSIFVQYDKRINRTRYPGWIETGGQNGQKQDNCQSFHLATNVLLVVMSDEYNQQLEEICRYQHNADEKVNVEVDPKYFQDWQQKEPAEAELTGFVIP